MITLVTSITTMCKILWTIIMMGLYEHCALYWFCHVYKKGWETTFFNDVMEAKAMNGAVKLLDNCDIFCFISH